MPMKAELKSMLLVNGVQSVMTTGIALMLVLSATCLDILSKYSSKQIFLLN